MTQLEMTTSTVSAGSGIASMSPLSHSTFSTPASSWFRRARASISSAHVEAVGLAGRADAAAESSTSMPPPEPRSSTVSPVVQLGDRGRVAAAERREHGGVGQLTALLGGVQRGAELLALLVGDHRGLRSAARRLLLTGRDAGGGGVAGADRLTGASIVSLRSMLPAARSLRLDVVVRPQSAALGVDQAGVAELLEVVRERRLPDVEERDELADADLARVLAQHVDELDAHRVPERLGDLRQSDRVVPPTSGWTSGSQQGSPIGRFCFGARTRSTLIDAIATARGERPLRLQGQRGSIPDESGAPRARRRRSPRGALRGQRSRPAGSVHPPVVEVMRELGIDLADRRPHRLDRADAEWADVVVTMGCGDACPYIPGKRYVDWDLPDPKGRPSTRSARSAMTSAPGSRRSLRRLA